VRAKVRAYDGSVYILHHNEVAGEKSFFSQRPA